MGEAGPLKHVNVFRKTVWDMSVLEQGLTVVTAAHAGHGILFGLGFIDVLGVRPGL